MVKTLYLECNSGISGDMTVAALLDLGADENVLRESLESMKLEGYELRIGRTKKCGIDACDFDVILLQDEAYENHEGDNDNHHDHIHDHNENQEHVHSHTHSENHDHNYDINESSDHGHVYSHRHSDQHEIHQHKIHQTEIHQHVIQEHAHNHGDNDNQKHTHHHPHEHRNIKDVNEIIDRLEDNDVKDLAKKIFLIVAKAEAKAHGIPLEEVHFHEVGAVDSIVDIVAVAICMKNLKITDVILSPLAEGSGTVRCQHGIIPVPVPAVLNIATMNELVIKSTGNKGEMITPTGAAIAAAIRTKDSLPDQYIVKKVGIGAGKKDFPTANIVRAILIEERGQAASSNSNEEKIQVSTNEQDEFIWKLESNIDDCTGEAFGYTMEKLLEAGALDVFYTPIYMKKNRPAYLLSVICKEVDRKKLENIIFNHTTTIGIRRIAYERTILVREIVEIETSYGTAKVKLCKRGDQILCYPEYESVRAICEKENMDFGQVYAFIINEYYQFTKEEKLCICQMR